MKLALEVRNELYDMVHERTGEFDLHDLVPAAVELIKYQDDEALAEVAFKALKSVADNGDPLGRSSGQGILFEYDESRMLALGDGHYCRMSDMTADMGRRRRELVTRNYKAVAAAWSAEDDYWQATIPALEERGGRLGDIEG